jgi:fructose-specific phosphotransferase system component IIB
MSTAIRLGFGLLTSLGVGAMAAAADKPAQKPEADQSAAIEELAHAIFANADRNHNQALNKSEFSAAQEMLQEEIQKLGQQGAIGKPKKPSVKDIEKAQGASAAADASAKKLSRSNKVTQAEFSYYVHAVVDEADEQWREMRAQADAQRKAYNLQRQMYGRRGRMRYPYQIPSY